MENSHIAYALDAFLFFYDETRPCRHKIMVHQVGTAPGVKRRITVVVTRERQAEGAGMDLPYGGSDDEVATSSGARSPNAHGGAEHSSGHHL